MAYFDLWAYNVHDHSHSYLISHYCLCLMIVLAGSSVDPTFLDKLETIFPEYKRPEMTVGGG